jgi:hypothetical protein
LEGGEISYITCSKETSIVVFMVDGIDGNDGGGGWHMGASTMDIYNGRGGAYGWSTGASTEDALNNKYTRDGQ